jgi:hypothetical protein
MATRLPGIQGLGLNNKTATYLKTVQGLGTPAARSILQPSPDMDVVRQRQAQYADYLGKTDYSAQNQEANDLAKLQFALSLMGRGFASMGAAPQPGENALGAVGRTLVAPLAGDISTIAGPLMKQRAATRLAEQQEERQLKLAALQKVEAENTQRAELAYKLLPADNKGGLTEAVQYVLAKGPNDKWDYVPQVGGEGRTQVRQQKGTGAPYNIVTMKVQPLQEGQVLVKPGDLEKFGLGDPTKPAAMKQGNRGFARRLDKDRKPTGGVVPLQYTFDPNTGTYTARTVGEGGPPPTVILSGENRTHVLTNEAGDIFGGAGKGTDAYKDNLVVVDKATGAPVIDTQGNWTQVSLRGNKLYKLGSTKVYIQPNNTRLKALSKFDTADSGGTKETDAQRQSIARRGLLLNSMAEIQVRKVRGPTPAYNAKAAFYFDAKDHLAEKFAFKYIPPGTDINDRSKDVTITDPSIIKLINNKLQNVSDTILKADFGDEAADTQRTRLQDAVRRMLSLPASTVFGAATIENIGTNAANQVIGYAPSADAISPAAVTDNAKTAMATLGNASNRYTPLLAVLAPLPDVDNEADSRTTWGRLKTAAFVFPGAFAYTGEGKPGTRDYDEQTVQQRLDIEAGLRNAALNPQASSTDHRAVLQKVAIASREKREKIQNKLSDDANELFETRLAFRDALLQFKNAAIETGLAGYATGTAAGFLTKVGFAEFISGEGSKHWARLKAASDRMSAGHSRRVGREFGDNRISNYDATDYKTLLPSIKNGEEFNRILVDDALKRTNVELTQLMENGGDVGWTRRQLDEAAKAGVDFSALRTKNNWHGHGYYGNNRYGASRQFTPTLSDAQRSATRTQGQLEATMYDNTYTVPGVDWRTEQNYTFGPWKPAINGEAASGTQPLRMDEPQFETWLIGRAKAAFGIPEDAEPTPTQIEEMRKRVVRGILSFNAWRENSQ